MSEFVVAAAEGAARNALEESAVVRLSAEDQRRFVELLLDGPEPTPALWRAHKALSKIGNSRTPREGWFNGANPVQDVDAWEGLPPDDDAGEWRW